MRAPNAPSPAACISPEPRPYNPNAVGAARPPRASGSDTQWRPLGHRAGLDAEPNDSASQSMSPICYD